METPPLYKLRDARGAVYEVVYQTPLTDDELDTLASEGWTILAVEHPVWTATLSA